MIIRSADGESLVNFDNLSLIQIEPYEQKVDDSRTQTVYDVVAYDTGCKTATPIGRYRTREKAVEVISDIVQTYAIDYCMGVYQMPPDEEPQED